MKRYKSICNFSAGEKKYFKGQVYNELPVHNKSFFVELVDEKEEREVSGQKVETASKKPKSKKR